MEGRDARQLAIRSPPADSSTLDVPIPKQMTPVTEKNRDSRQGRSSQAGVTVQHPPDSDMGTPPPTRETPAWNMAPPFFGYPMPNGMPPNGFPNQPGFNGYPPSQGPNFNPSSQGPGQNQPPNGFNPDQNAPPPGFQPPPGFPPGSGQFGDGNSFPGPNGPPFPPMFPQYMGGSPGNGPQNGMDPMMQMMMTNPFQAAMGFGGGMSPFFGQQQPANVIVNQFYFNGVPKKSLFSQSDAAKKGSNSSPVLIELDDELNEPSKKRKASGNETETDQKASFESGEVCKLCCTLLDRKLLPRFASREAQRMHAKKHSEQNDQELEETMAKCFGSSSDSPKTRKESERRKPEAPPKIPEPEESFLELSRKDSRKPSPTTRHTQKRKTQPAPQTQKPSPSPSITPVTKTAPTPPQESRQVPQRPQPQPAAPPVPQPTPPEMTSARRPRRQSKVSKPSLDESSIQIISPPQSVDLRPSRPANSQPKKVYPVVPPDAPQRVEISKDRPSGKVPHPKLKQALIQVSQLTTVRCQVEDCKEVVDKKSSPLKQHLTKHFVLDQKPCPQCKVHTKWFSTQGHERCNVMNLHKQMTDYEEMLINCMKVVYAPAFGINATQANAIAKTLAPITKAPPVQDLRSEVELPVEEVPKKPTGEPYKMKLKKLMSHTNRSCHYPNCNKDLVRTATAVQNHIVNHFQIECFRCKICNEVVTPWSLAVHGKSHGGKKDFDDLRECDLQQQQLCAAMDTCFPQINVTSK